ncbi:MAG: hypothetical protein ABI151_11810 [Chitinophagaceae bacterium]
MQTHKRKIFLLTIFTLIILVFNQCLDEQKVGPDPRGPGYADAGKCMNCHREIYTSYLHTSHASTSSAASKSSILGSFAHDSNSFSYRADLKIIMEQNDSGFYQVSYLNHVKQKVRRFDIVTGSGRKGQSYLYWQKDNIFQLPVSYDVAGKNWVNSPGFPSDNVQFTRGISIGCFECHSSYIKKTASEATGRFERDHFKRGSIIYGIDCQRCHGAAQAHVNFHEDHPLEKEARYIVAVKSLGRQAQLDMCAVCHSGARKSIKASFDYKPGSKLSEYLPPDTSVVNPAEIDVHGKQYQSLNASQCFRKSSMLTCNTCHNTHVTERGNMKLFSSQCMSCHSTVKHANLNVSETVRANLINNCIDCHMPAKPSKLITMLPKEGGENVAALVRTHFIAIYPEATLKFSTENKR